MSIELRSKTVTVTTSGTPVQLNSTELLAHALTIVALSTNAGDVHVSDSTVNSSTGLGVPLAANEQLELVAPQRFGVDEQYDLSKIYVDAVNSGDKVSVTYVVRVG